MKIVASSIILLYFVNLTRGQRDVDSETKVMGDSGWWSRRIAKINRKEEHRIGLASRDNRKENGRWKEETEIRDSRRRPRPFSSLLRSNTETRYRDSFESQRERHRNGKVTLIVMDLNVSTVPSPILLPPYATPSPVYRDNNISDENSTRQDWNNESLLNNEKSSISSALDRIRIYEISTLNSTNELAIESKLNYTNDDSLQKFNVKNEKNRRINVDRETYVDVTETRNNDKETEERKDVRDDSFYIDEKPENERIVGLKTPTNRSNLIKNPRGNRRYHDNLLDEKGFMTKRTFTGSVRYDWRGRSGQRSNHFGFSGDTSREVGSVPGLPGRDYPIHQEHTHHHLRNIADRFPCPQTPKTHVYLADRASRCQIFYVCYGSKTGVPMVCPNGTLFSEPLQVCDWWYNVAC